MTAWRSLTWWVGIGLIALAAAAMVAAADWSMGGRLFPWFVGSVMIGAVGLHTALGLAVGVRAEIEPETADGQPIPRSWRLKVLAWIALMLVLVPLIGHVVAVPLYIVVFMLANGERLALAAPLAAGVWAFIYFILEGVIHVDLPPALLLQWLG